MKARMKDNLVERYEKALPGELDAQADRGKETKTFLRKIQGTEVELIFTAGDAFEKKDNDIFLPSDLWDEI